MGMLTVFVWLKGRPARTKTRAPAARDEPTTGDARQADKDGATTTSTPPPPSDRGDATTTAPRPAKSARRRSVPAAAKRREPTNETAAAPGTPETPAAPRDNDAENKDDGSENGLDM